MKKLFSILLTSAMLAALLCGCVCESADTVITSDGSGTIRAKFGFSEAIAERLDLYEALEEENFEEFIYMGKTYIGDSVEQTFASVAEFNDIFSALGEKAASFGEAGGIGELTLSQSGDALTLIYRCGDKTGSKSAMSAALCEKLPTLTAGEVAELLTDAVMTYSFVFPAEVRQSSGGSSGIEVSGSTVKIDLLACAAGSYIFTTGEESVVCDRGMSCPLNRYTDMKSSGWYHDGVHYCIEHGMMNGTTETLFSPAEPATRGMIFTILARMDGVRITSSGSTWYADGAAWAARTGISDGSEPNAAVTRAQLALMLYRYAQYAGYHTDSRADISGFADAAEVDAWMREALQWACGSGIMGGDDRNMVTPLKGASRTEAATMLFRFCTGASA